MLEAASTHPTVLPKPLQSSSLENRIGGAPSSNIQASQTNSWGGSTRAEGNHCVIIRCFSANKTSNGIAKATATNQSGNWDRWCIFLKHSGISDIFLGGGSKIAEENPRVVICRFSATKPVRHNHETTTSPRNCQVRHIGCICILPDAPPEGPNPRGLRSNILTITETNKGLKNSGSKSKTSKRYTRKSSPSHLQADKHTSENSHRPTYFRRIFLQHTVLRVIN